MGTGIQVSKLFSKLSQSLVGTPLFNLRVCRSRLKVAAYRWVDSNQVGLLVILTSRLEMDKMERSCCSGFPERHSRQSRVRRSSRSGKEGSPAAGINETIGYSETFGVYFLLFRHSIYIQIFSRYVLRNSVLLGVD